MSGATGQTHDYGTGQKALHEYTETIAEFVDSQRFALHKHLITILGYVTCCGLWQQPGFPKSVLRVGSLMKLAFSYAGTQGSYGYACIFELKTDAFRQAEYECFGCGIGGHVRNGLKCGCAGHIHDTPVSAGLHVSCEHFGEIGQTDHV